MVLLKSITKTHHEIMKQNFTLCLFLIAVAVTLFSFTDSDAQTDLKKSMERGKRIYGSYCQTCHMQNGLGIEGVFPPLAKSDYLMADRQRSIHQILNGASGKMVVNGKTYNGNMPPQGLTAKQTADVLNYIMNSWGNKAEIVTVGEVKAAQKKK
ncbi:major anaerobically induced transmembrane protein [Microscilla marina ATCC 23134]|uniref:Major anaerobically induced transmembrane protein n=2 Tax=Microscilla marina TaxID=1027 RepID=A1ZLK0_MICM2|nr:major anaerobically induced transmembrane protein [Microscilla marina ATCC 23134]